jgi:predicted ATP-grasp superfamily ATP-dependent carboligase
MASALSLPEHVFDRIPVVLLGGVNLVRALGLAGIPAIVASPSEHEPAFASRYCAARCLLPPYSQADAAVDAIVTIGDRLVTMYGRRVPLFYGSDDALKLIYAHRERLERYYLLLLNDEQVAEALLTKDGFQEFARRRGLPVPAALSWDGEGAAAVAAHEGPVIVKPSNKDGWSDSLLRKRAFGRAKALVFPSGAEAASDPVIAHFRDQLTCQQYVSGDDRSNWSFHGFADAKGHVLQSFVGRKLRTCPPDNGESAYIELAVNEELTALGTRLAACLPLKGIFKMDFKQDARTGRWYLLEVNARFNLWQYLGAVNGVNLMRAAYDFLLDGKRPAQPAYRTTKRWLSLELDARAFRDLRREGKLGLARWVLSLAFARKVYNLFAWSDPGPWASFWKRRLTRLGTRAPARFLTMVRQWRSTAS